MPRYFTPEEANPSEEGLPRLREIVTRLQERQRTLDQRQEELAALAQRATGNGRAFERVAQEALQVAERLAQEIKSLVAEVQALDCEVKDLERGLVDFPAWREGRLVYLCWMLGEDEVAYWHDSQTDFAGRRPLWE